MINHTQQSFNNFWNVFLDTESMEPGDIPLEMIKRFGEPWESMKRDMEIDFNETCVIARRIRQLDDETAGIMREY